MVVVRLHHWGLIETMEVLPNDIQERYYDAAKEFLLNRYIFTAWR